jgi:hypothetical protein
MRQLPHVFALIAILFVPISNASETYIRPGLWEITTTSDLLWLMPQIPPDQMQNLIDLAKANGFDMPQIQNGAASSNACITQKMADQKNIPYFYPNQLECTTKNATRNENSYKFDFVCTSEQLKGNGSAQGTFTNTETFSGRTKFDGIAQGFPVNEQADINGRWVSSNCGSVKPLE